MYLPMTWNRFVLSIGILVIASLVIVALTPAVNSASRLIMASTDIQRSDAIVVLGGGLKRDGTLTYESMQRFVYGLRLYKQGYAPILVLCGPPHTNTAPEAAVRARIAAEFGTPLSAIVEIGESRTTREEALATAKTLKESNRNHILLVTGALHMGRSKRVFEAAGLVVSTAPSDNFPAIANSPASRLFLLEELVMHSAGFLYYRLAGFI
jgi:uncharacterized SAM-binding protein YcdF (DUF218 family)